ncbi:PaaI family thioesterase [Paenalkalicoccus suaedae]|uniref:PaaI family thioesterase n=1 Tax=Paenalkalicoccus suaedae TaxID=2592382 RepID=A0A859FES1_9BACI|nr:PaaI family thioesterase [Paenalkalicoccus suaedae]QKS70736.1 PaaI family thioesterase [Paenalkalicoccus suaedae]
MDKQKWTKQAEAAVEAHTDGSPDVFMYKMLDMTFDYFDDPEEVVVKAPVTEIMLNPVGFIHGGIMTYLADSAMGHLCAAFNDLPSVSLELKTQFLRTVKTGSLTAKASFLKKGRGVQFVECIIYDDEERVLCKTTGTFYQVDPTST